MDGVLFTPATQRCYAISTLFDYGALERTRWAQYYVRVAEVLRVSDGDLPVAEAFGLVQNHLALSFGSQQHVTNQRAQLRRLEFVVGEFGVSTVGGITEEVLLSFFDRPVGRTTRSSNPTLSALRQRKMAIETFYRTLRNLGFRVYSPLSDLRLSHPPRTVPLLPTDGDVQTMKDVATTLTDIGTPALVLELALSGASNFEISQSMSHDVLVEETSIVLHGSPKVDRRVNPLDDWLAERVLRLVASLGGENRRLVTTASDQIAAAASVSNAFRRICRLGGLREKYTIDSVRRWKAIKEYEATNNLLTTSAYLGRPNLEIVANWVLPERRHS